MNHAQFWGGRGAAPYEIEQSLRFDGGGSKLVLASPSSSYTINKFTMSCWVKMGPIASDFRMMSRDGAPTTVTNTWCNFNPFGNNVIASYMYTASINGRGVLNTLGTQRDPSAWYHIVFGYDSGSGNTQRIWVNGVEQTTGKDTISGVAGFEWSSTYPFVIGGGTSHGYCAEYHFIDNTWLDSPDDFGELNDQGVWVPKEYTGSYGTNGFYLKFDPTATNGIGHDHSGTGNHMTASGFTTSGTGTDVMSDTPTNNFATFNPLLYSNSNSTYSEGNLKVTSNSSWTAISTIPFPQTGKFYIEVTIDGVNEGYPTVGIADVTTNFNSGGYNFANSVGLRPRNNDSQKPWWFKDGTDVTARISDTAVSAGDIFQCIYDADNNKVWFGINNTYYGLNGSTSTTVSASDIASGTNPAKTLTSSDTYILQVCPYVSAGATVNFGQRAFAYTPPTGFNALNTSNLSAPPVKDGSDYFNTVLYSGNGSTQSITGVGFSPSFVWTKGRAGSYGVSNHKLFDTVRGATKTLFGNLTLAEATQTNGLTSFDSDGFSLGNDTNVNASSTTFVAWNWLASNTSGSSNTDGSITSTVSANPSAGFSIVSYTGTGANATVGHGLGVAPSMMIIKRRNSTDDWGVYHISLGNGNYMYLNQTQASSAAASIWNNTTPTGSVFSVGTSLVVNANTGTYIAYCFAEVEGYSKFGSYTGNGNADGPFVFCGFKPRWIMLKKSNTSTIYTSWSIYDTARDSYNVSDAPLYANVADQEGTNSQGTVESGHNVDILSNGFKLRDSNQIRNTSGDTYIFAAFAEHPTGGDGVSPATAR